MALSDRSSSEEPDGPVALPTNTVGVTGGHRRSPPRVRASGSAGGGGGPARVAIQSTTVDRAGDRLLRKRRPSWQQAEYRGTARKRSRVVVVEFEEELRRAGIVPSCSSDSQDVAQTAKHAQDAPQSFATNIPSFECLSFKALSQLLAVRGHSPIKSVLQLVSEGAKEEFAKKLYDTVMDEALRKLYEDFLLNREEWVKGNLLAIVAEDSLRPPTPPLLFPLPTRSSRSSASHSPPLDQTQRPQMGGHLEECPRLCLRSHLAASSSTGLPMFPPMFMNYPPLPVNPTPEPVRNLRSGQAPGVYAAPACRIATPPEQGVRRSRTSSFRSRRSADEQLCRNGLNSLLRTIGAERIPTIDELARECANEQDARKIYRDRVSHSVAVLRSRLRETARSAAPLQTRKRLRGMPEPEEVPRRRRTAIEDHLDIMEYIQPGPSQPPPEDDDDSAGPCDIDDNEDENTAKTSVFGSCRICYEDEVPNPVGCLNCRQFIGCKRCTNLWMQSSRVLTGTQRGSCPHCRNIWDALPEVAPMSVFAD